MAGMAKNLALLTLAFFLFIAVIAVGYLIWQNMQLSAQLRDLSAKQAGSEMKLQQLSEEHNQLSGSYTRLSQQLEEEKKNVSASAVKISLLQQQLSEKEKQLAESKVNLEQQEQKVAAIYSDLSFL